MSEQDFSTHAYRAPDPLGPFKVIDQYSSAGRRRRLPLGLGFALIVLVFLFVIGLFVSFDPNPIGTIRSAFDYFHPVATIHLSPKHQTMSEVISFSAGPGAQTKPGQQIATRVISQTAPVQSQEAKATGLGHTAATTAHGILDFYNEDPYALTIAGGTVLTGADGVQVETDGAVQIPAGNPPSYYGSNFVSAHAVLAGSGGNIRVLDLNGPCCAAGILVKNREFMQGRDPQPYRKVQQSDLEGIKGTLGKTLEQQAQVALMGKLNINEQPAQSPQCTSTATSDPPVGTPAAQVNVTITSRCHVEVYDAVSATRLARDLYPSSARQRIGSDYAILAPAVSVGNPLASVGNAQGTISLIFRMQGVWGCQFTRAQQQRLLQKLEGMKRQEASNFLRRIEGIGSVRIDLHGGDGVTLPTTSDQITLLIADQVAPSAIRGA